MNLKRVYRKIRWFYPEKYLKWLDKNLIYAGVSTGIENFLSLSFLYSLAFAAFGYSIALVLGQPLISVAVFIAVLFGFQLILDLFIVLIGDRRGKFAENVLPDALQLMAANIRSGLTPDKALLFTARPEFGILEKEIKLAASQAVAGEPLEETLVNLGRRIKSKIINRTFGLIVEGMKKGGEMASLLEQTSEDIRNLKILKKEVSAQVKMYAIFIFFAAGFAAPILFGFSSYLIETFTQIGSTLHLERATSYRTALRGLTLSFVSYPTDFLMFYTFGAMTINSFFASLFIGMIQEGNKKAGIKFIPILLTLNIVLYLVSRMFIVQLTGIFAPTATLPT